MNSETMPSWKKPDAKGRWFEGDFEIKYTGKTEWLVSNTFHFHTGDGARITVPREFETDGASIPRFFWRLMGHPFALYAPAAAVHDFLYWQDKCRRKKADLVFLEAMEVCGIRRLRRWLIYKAVRLGGWAAWNRHRRREKRELDRLSRAAGRRLPK